MRGRSVVVAPLERRGMMFPHRRAPVAAVQCEMCPSDTADPFFVHDHDRTLICVVFRCVVCGYLSIA